MAHLCQVCECAFEAYPLSGQAGTNHRFIPPNKTRDWRPHHFVLHRTTLCPIETSGIRVPQVTWSGDIHINHPRTSWERGWTETSFYKLGRPGGSVRHHCPCTPDLPTAPCFSYFPSFLHFPSLSPLRCVLYWVPFKPWTSSGLSYALITLWALPYWCLFCLYTGDFQKRRLSLDSSLCSRLIRPLPS